MCFKKNLTGNDCWFQNFLLQHLEGLYHFIMTIVPCLCKIFLGPQAQTLLISGTRNGEGRNIENATDSTMLLFFRPEILF